MLCSLQSKHVSILLSSLESWTPHQRNALLSNSYLSDNKEEGFAAFPIPAQADHKKLKHDENARGRWWGACIRALLVGGARGTIPAWLGLTELDKSKSVAGEAFPAGISWIHLQNLASPVPVAIPLRDRLVADHGCGEDVDRY